MTLADSIKEIPPVTRFFTICTVLVCAGHSLGIIDLGVLHLDFDGLARQALFAWPYIRSGSLTDRCSASLYLIAQSYRVFTTFLLPWGLIFNERFQALCDIYFFYTFANHLENGKFKRNFPDTVWFILTTGTMMVVLSLFAHLCKPSYLPVFHSLMLSCIEYIWLRLQKNANINLFGLIPIKAYHLPFAKMFVGFILRGSTDLVDLLVGVSAGYFYQCIQSGTVPFYNLVPGFYGGAFDQPARNGRRVGNVFSSSNSDIIQDSVFDLGYLKAPLFLYRFLQYPLNNSVRTTAFDLRTAKTTRRNNIAPQQIPSDSDYANDPENAGSSSSYDVFKGKGHRLYD